MKKTQNYVIFTIEETNNQIDDNEKTRKMIEEEIRLSSELEDIIIKIKNEILNTTTKNEITKKEIFLRNKILSKMNYLSEDIVEKIEKIINVNEISLVKIQSPFK